MIPVTVVYLPLSGSHAGVGLSMRRSFLERGLVLRPVDHRQNIKSKSLVQERRFEEVQ